MTIRTRRAISDIERKAIFAAWHNVCAYCETNPAEVVDHIVPFSKGGACEVENFAASCTRCNLRKTNNSLGEGYLQIILALALNRAEKIKEAIARSQKLREPKPTKAAKPVAPKQDYIKASQYGDWTDLHTEILALLTGVNDCIYTFTAENESVLESLYVFCILVKQGNRAFSPFNGITYHYETKQAELRICAEGIPYLQKCAEQRVKAKEIILI